MPQETLTHTKARSMSAIACLHQLPCFGTLASLFTEGQTTNGGNNGALVVGLSIRGNFASGLAGARQRNYAGQDQALTVWRAARRLQGGESLGYGWPGQDDSPARGDQRFHLFSGTSRGGRGCCDVRGCTVDAMGQRLYVPQIEADEHRARCYLHAGRRHRLECDRSKRYFGHAYQRTASLDDYVAFRPRDHRAAADA